MMEGSFIRLGMVFLICCTISVFFITSCVSKKNALMTPQERSVIQLQDAFESCLNRTDDDLCLPYMESLKKSHPLLNQPRPVAAHTAP